MDLFNDIDSLPVEVQSLIERMGTEDEDYRIVEDYRNRLNVLGYTFEYGLDAIPYDLKPKN